MNAASLPRVTTRPAAAEDEALLLAVYAATREAELELTSSQAINPLTRKVIDRVAFTIMGDRLLYVGPPEFVGAQPINVAFLSPSSRLEDLVVQTLNDHLYQLERRSRELTTIGLNPRVEPKSLSLTAELGWELLLPVGPRAPSDRAWPADRGRRDPGQHTFARFPWRLCRGRCS